LPEQAAHPLRITAAEVLVADGDLDQPVQQSPPGAGGATPHLFPLVVTRVEVVLVEEF
jgi:hypothetical protein